MGKWEDPEFREWLRQSTDEIDRYCKSQRIKDGVERCVDCKFYLKCFMLDIACENWEEYKKLSEEVIEKVAERIRREVPNIRFCQMESPTIYPVLNDKGEIEIRRFTHSFGQPDEIIKVYKLQ